MYTYTYMYNHVSKIEYSWLKKLESLTTGWGNTARRITVISMLISAAVLQCCVV